MKKNEEMEGELKNWIKNGGNEKNFIEFKKYQYNQVFWLVAFQMSFSILIISILIAFMDLLINLMGFPVYLTLFGCNFYFIYRFSLKVVPKANKKAINNIEYLLTKTPNSPLNTN